MESKTNNYFVVDREPFFFNDRDATSTDRAYEAARAHQQLLATFTVPGEVHIPRIAVWTKQRVSLQRVSSWTWNDVVLIGGPSSPRGVPDLGALPPASEPASAPS